MTRRPMSCRNRKTASTASRGFCGEADTAAFRARLSDRIMRVETITGAFFSPLEAETEVPDIGRGGRGHRRALARLSGAALDARAGESSNGSSRVSSRPSTRPPSPSRRCRISTGFLRGLPAGVQLFSMFEANPQLVELIVDISATAPRLSRYLSRHSAVLDAVA